MTVALMLGFTAGSQDTPGIVSTIPGDPKELMLLAAPLNSLTNGDLKPWHLKATYKILNDHGVTTDDGTYEEFWSGPTQFKRTFTGNGFTQTDYGTARGVLRSGFHDDVNPDLLIARRELVSAMPAQQVIDQQNFTIKQIDSNGTHMACVSTTPAWGLTYCFDPQRPMLRVTSNAGTSQVLHNRILRFQEHYVAGDLTIISNGKPILTAHVDSIVPLDAGSEAQFAPAADAVLLPRRVNISAGVAVGMLEKHDAPDYPLDARMSHISGTVVLQAIINTEGHIKELKVVSGPSQLQQAALEAVHKWRYRPYLLNGEPVEVLTTVNVVFTLGR